MCRKRGWCITEKRPRCVQVLITGTLTTVLSTDQLSPSHTTTTTTTRHSAGTAPVCGMCCLFGFSQNYLVWQLSK